MRSIPAAAARRCGPPPPDALQPGMGNRDHARPPTGKRMDFDHGECCHPSVQYVPQVRRFPTSCDHGRQAAHPAPAIRLPFEAVGNLATGAGSLRADPAV